jgi:HEPN domain-containing protein
MLTIGEKYQYWLSYAKNDMDTAEAMFSAGRWLYVLVTCQQALEKMAKGLYLLYVDDNIPRIHDINAIITRFEDKLPEPAGDARSDLFENLSKYYLRSRYPDYANDLSAVVSQETAKDILDKTKEAYQWLLTMKPSIPSLDNTSGK